jgi:hypothetical protein
MQVKRALLAFALLLAPGSARAVDGAYGGLALAGSLEPFGAGNELERSCADLGAASCSTPVPFGGGLFGYVGWIPTDSRIGYEVMFGGFVDYTRPSASYDGVPHVAHGNPLFAAPPRDETFIILRGGGVLAPRVRTWFNRGAPVTWTLAGGLGLAFRYMALEREVTADGGLEDRPYFSHGTSYWSPGVSLDGAAHVRTTPTLAVALGLSLWGETAWGNTRSVADPTRILEGNGKAAPINTPAYLMAHGVQIMVMPYVGLTFGP